MKIDTTPLEDHQVKLTVEVEKAQLDDAKQKSARSIAKRVKIPGFRPGKAPYSVIVRHYGEAAILEEAVDLLAKDLYPKILDEAEIKPYGPGSLLGIPSMDPLVLEFSVPLQAEAILGDYQEVRHPYEPPELSQKEVDDVVENLRGQHAILEPADRPVAEGDMVTVKIEGTRIATETDSNTNLVKDRSLPLLVHPAGHQDIYEWPYPGFSRALIGMAVEETQELDHTFSDDSVYDSLKNESAHFSFTVEEVKSRALPEMNDEFATTVGEYASLDVLMQEIRQSLLDRKLETYHSEYDEAVLGHIIEISSVKYPPQMLQTEIDEMIHSLEHRLEDQHVDLDLYLKSRQLDLDGLKAEIKPTAETRIKRSLVLIQVAESEKIVVQPDELQAETNRAVSNLARQLPEKELKRFTSQEGIQNLVSNVMAEMMTRKTLERIRDIGSGKIELEAANAEEIVAATTEEMVAAIPVGQAEESLETVEEQVTEGVADTDIPPAE